MALLCLLLPTPPLSKCWREFNIFWSGYFAFVLFIIIVIIIINIIIIIITVIIIVES